MVLYITVQFRYVMPVVLFSLYLLYGMVRPWISQNMRKGIEAEIEPDTDDADDTLNPTDPKA
jgi:CDP-diacylglycerol---serine O-phosphatidyltransferase